MAFCRGGYMIGKLLELFILWMLWVMLSGLQNTFAGMGL
jgi:hypothetical protein